MRFFSIIILILPIFLYFIFRNKKYDLFMPLNLYTFLYAIKIVLPCMVYSNPENIPIADDFFLERALQSDESFYKYACLQSLGYCLVLLGLKISIQKYLKSYLNSDQKVLTEKNLSVHYKVWGFLLYFLGTIGFIVIMNKVGGIVFFFSNLQLRSYLVRDLDFESYLLGFLNYAPLLLIYSKKWNKNNITIIDAVLILFAGLMVGLGGRKALIMLIVECSLIYHFVVTRIEAKRFFKFKYIALAIAIFFFFTTYSKFRKEGAIEDFLSNPIGFYSENVSGDFNSLLAGESYVPFYVAVVDYFDKNPKWDGASYLSLLTAFIPSSFYANKPPVDDGMYLYSIAKGKGIVKPPMPTKQLDGTSWPLETFGAAYANYGSIGVIVAMFLLGLILGQVFVKMIISKYGFAYVTFYIIMFFTFELSTLRIVQSIIAFCILYFVQFIVNRIK